MRKLFNISKVRCTSTLDQIFRAESSLDISFPESYKSFCLQYGFGLIGGLYMIYIPLEDIYDPASMTYRARHLRERLNTYRDSWVEDDMRVGIDVWEGVDDADIVERALFIGQSENGHEIFWDVDGGGEYKIYVEIGSTIRYGGSSLNDLVLRCQTDEVKTIFGPGYKPLPATFEGRSVSMEPS